MTSLASELQANTRQLQASIEEQVRLAGTGQLLDPGGGDAGEPVQAQKLKWNENLQSLLFQVIEMKIEFGAIEKFKM